MKTTQIIFTTALAVVVAILLTLRVSNTIWEQEAIDSGVARYHPDTGKFEWTNVKILPQWNKIKQLMEFLDEQRKRARFNGQIPSIVPQQPSMPQDYQASSYQTL